MSLCKKEKKCIVYVALHVDDNLMTGDCMAIDNTMTTIKENWLVLKL